MKRIIITLIILFSLKNYSQCEKIINIYDEMKNERTLSSPHKSNFSLITGTIKNNNEISVSRVINEDSDRTFIFFKGYGSSSLIGSKGLYVKLSNNEIIRLENNSISSSYLSNGIYLYISILYLDEDNIDLFTNNNIIQFDMSIYKFTTKEKKIKDLKDYISCVYNFK